MSPVVQCCQRSYDHAKSRSRQKNSCQKHKIRPCPRRGGSEIIGELLRHGQGSNTILEAVVPYCQSAYEEFIGGPPDKFVSEEAACQLAMAAFQKIKVEAGQPVLMFHDHLVHFLVLDHLETCPQCLLSYYYEIMLLDDEGTLRVGGNIIDRCGCGLCHDCCTCILVIPVQQSQANPSNPLDSAA